jgi:hypothetical protein
VVAEPGVVGDAVAESLGHPVVLHSELDVDVFRLRPANQEPDLVARVFGPDVDRTTLDAAARVLQRLADTRFPAERCPTGSPVLPIGGGRHLLITGYVDPAPAPRPGFALAWCAALLGTLAKRSGAGLPPGGGWHRLGATPSAEIDHALRLADDLGSSVASLADVLADADDGTGLPQGLIHADLTPPNLVLRGDQPPIVIDWVGVGHGPRAWSLAFLLFVAGPRGARRGLDRYHRSVALCEEERHRLPELMIVRPVTLDVWSVAYERMTPRQAVTRLRTHRARVEAIMTALNDPEPP